jgi:hypothetical protein
LDGSALVVGDKLIMVAGYNGTANRPATPTGWTSLSSDAIVDGPTNVGLRFWVKEVGVGEPTSYTVTLPASIVSQGAIWAVSGAPDNLSEFIPEIHSNIEEVSGRLLSTTGMVKDAASSILLAFFHSRAGSLVNSSTCDPVTFYGEKFDVNTAALSANKAVLQGVYWTAAPVGAQNPLDFRVTEPAAGRAALWLELRPPKQELTSPTPIDPPANQVPAPTIPPLLPDWQSNAAREIDVLNSAGFTIPHGDPGASLPKSGLWVVGFYAHGAIGGGTIIPPPGYTLRDRTWDGEGTWCYYTKNVEIDPVVPAHETFSYSVACNTIGFFGVIRNADIYHVDGAITNQSSIGDSVYGFTLPVAETLVAEKDSKVMRIAFARDVTGGFSGPTMQAPSPTSLRPYIQRLMYGSTASGVVNASSVLVFDHLEPVAGVTAPADNVSVNRNVVGQSFTFVVRPVSRFYANVIGSIDPPGGQVPSSASVLHVTDPADPGTFGLPEDSEEITSERTRTRKLYVNPNGLSTEVIRQQLHYQDGIQFFDINLDLLPTGGSEYTMNSHDIRVKAKTSALDPTVLVTERVSGKGLQIALPSAPTQVFKNRVSFLWRGRTWNYQIRERGLKLSATFSTAQGLTSYEFYYDVIGGASQPTVDANGNIQTDSFTVPRPYILGADNEIYDAGPWILDTINERFTIAFDDSVLPAEAFPYVLDPTTDMPITADPNDDWAIKGDDVYPPAAGRPVKRVPATIIGPAKTKQAANYSVKVGLLKFDTSKTPTSSIIGDCFLRLRVADADAVNGGTLYIQWYNWNGTDSDFVVNAATTENAVTAYPISGLQPGQDIEIPLSNADQYLVRGGVTGLRLMISNVTPTGLNQLLFYASEDTNNPPPTLVYNYSEIADRRGVTTATANSGASLTFTKPTGSVSGDVALIAVWGGTSDGSAPGTRVSYAVRQAGFTSLGFRDVGTSERAQVFIKRLGTEDAAISTYHVDWTTARDAVGAFMVYQRGSGNVDDFVTALDAASSRILEAPQADVDYAPTRVVTLFAATRDDSFIPTATSGLKKWFEVKNSTAPNYLLAGSDFVHRTLGLTPTGKSGKLAVADTNRVTITIPLITTQVVVAPTPVDPPANQVPAPVVTPGSRLVFPTSIAPPVDQVPTQFVDQRIHVTNSIPPPDPLTQVPAPRMLRGLSPVSIPPPTSQVPSPVITPGNSYVNPTTINPPANQVPAPKTELTIRPIPIAPPPFATQVSPAAIALEPPLVQVLSLEAKKEALKLSGERGRVQYSPKLFLSNIRGDELQELPGVIAATVNMSNARNVSWNLTLDVMVTDSFDPVHDYVLVAMDVRSDLIREWSRYYLGLYRFALPGGTDKPEGSFWKLDGQSLEYLLLQDLATGGYNLKRREFILEAVENILRNKGNIPDSKIAFPPRSQDVRSKHGTHLNPIDDGDEAYWLAISNNLLLQGGFEPLQTDAYGRFTTRSARALEDLDPTAKYGPRSDERDDMIIGSPLDFTPDYANFANEIMVYSKETMEAEPGATDCVNTDEEPAEPIYHTMRNLNEDSPVSIPNLGYTISRSIGYDQIANKTAAKRLARRKLSKASSYSIGRSVPTMLDPRRGIDEVYRMIARNKRGILVMDGNWAVESYDLPLPISGPPGVMTHNVNRVEKITEAFPF